ncbi:MAG: alpha/beta fold hydrolase, partial [Anaerolineae bacterium]|nr:alpha/beta fold hydrolase [Anaerolineae bacterium]
EFGWAAQLGADFTVISVDLRGCGESSGFDDPARYSAPAHLDDLRQIAAACGADRFAVVGYSWGGTIARNAAAELEQVTRAVMIGSYFGHIFTEEYVRPRMEHFERLARLKAAGDLDDLDEKTRAFVEETDFLVYLARRRALPAWPPVEPGDLRCPALVITGTEDGNVVHVLRDQRAAIESAGGQLVIFDGLTHPGLIHERDTVLPRVRAFLLE